MTAVTLVSDAVQLHYFIYNPEMEQRPVEIDSTSPQYVYIPTPQLPHSFSSEE
jgi:hypothetical protein